MSSMTSALVTSTFVMVSASVMSRMPISSVFSMMPVISVVTVIFIMVSGSAFNKEMRSPVKEVLPFFPAHPRWFGGPT